VPTIMFQPLYCFVVLYHRRRYWMLIRKSSPTHPLTRVRQTSRGPLSLAANDPLSDMRQRTQFTYRLRSNRRGF
jgi:hypothetical protein